MPLANSTLARLSAAHKGKSSTYNLDHKPLYPSSAGMYESTQGTARKAGFVLSKELARTLTDSTFERMEAILASGNSLHLPGVGTLRIVVRSGKRVGLRFLPSRILKQKLSEIRP